MIPGAALTLTLTPTWFFSAPEFSEFWIDGPEVRPRGVGEGAVLEPRQAHHLRPELHGSEVPGERRGRGLRADGWLMQFLPFAAGEMGCGKVASSKKVTFPCFQGDDWGRVQYLTATGGIYSI